MSKTRTSKRQRRAAQRIGDSLSEASVYLAGVEQDARSAALPMEVVHDMLVARTMVGEARDAAYGIANPERV